MHLTKRILDTKALRCTTDTTAPSRIQFLLPIVATLEEVLAAGIKNAMQCCYEKLCLGS